jgi:hypothetical protein
MDRRRHTLNPNPHRRSDIPISTLTRPSDPVAGRLDGATVVICTTVVDGATGDVAVWVNASKPPAAFLNRPAAVQFPADPHDTE